MKEFELVYYVFSVDKRTYIKIPSKCSFSVADVFTFFFSLAVDL